MKNGAKMIFLGTVTFSCGVVVGYHGCKMLITSILKDREYLYKKVVPIIESKIGKDKLERMAKIYFEEETVTEEAMNEVVEAFKKEFPKKRNKGIQPEYIFQSRMEAGETLDALFTMINDYGVVTIADVRDLIGEQSSFRDNQFGWTNLNDASIKRVREGYLLELPASALLHISF